MLDCARRVAGNLTKFRIYVRIVAIFCNVNVAWDIDQPSSVRWMNRS